MKFSLASLLSKFNSKKQSEPTEPTVPVSEKDEFIGFVSSYVNTFNSIINQLGSQFKDDAIVSKMEIRRETRCAVGGYGKHSFYWSHHFDLNLKDIDYDLLWDFTKDHDNFRDYRIQFTVSTKEDNISLYCHGIEFRKGKVSNPEFTPVHISNLPQLSSVEMGIDRSYERLNYLRNLKNKLSELGIDFSYTTGERRSDYHSFYLTECPHRIKFPTKHFVNIQHQISLLPEGTLEGVDVNYEGELSIIFFGDDEKFDDVVSRAEKVLQIVGDMFENESLLLKTNLSKIILIQYTDRRCSDARLYASKASEVEVTETRIRYTNLFTGLECMILIGDQNVSGVLIDDLTPKHKSLLPKHQVKMDLLGQGAIDAT